MPVRIDEIESDIELDGDRAPEAPGGAPPGATADHGIDALERRMREDERTCGWDFDD